MVKFGRGRRGRSRGFWERRRRIGVTFACCKNVFVVPRLLILFQWLVEGCKLAVDDEMTYDLLVPVLGASIYALGGEGAKIHSIVNVTLFGSRDRIPHR